MKNKSFLMKLTCLISVVAVPLFTHAAGLIASDGEADDFFGNSVSQSGNMGLVGALEDGIGVNSYQGSSYLFRNLNTATGTVTQNAKLIASDGAAGDLFGSSMSLSANSGLVGAFYDAIGDNTRQGSAYVFRNLSTVTGTVTQNAKLVASDGLTDDEFGFVSLSGNIGLIGAIFSDIGPEQDQGSAYVFRDLDTATGTVTQNAKLIASDGAVGDKFGNPSLSGSIGLVGALYDDIGSRADQGSAYVFRNLDTVTGTITENAKLIASDGAADAYFGSTVSLSGSVGLIGAGNDTVGVNRDQGSAYVFRNLDTVTGTVTQNAKLIASDGTAGAYFGSAVSLSGNIGIIGNGSDTIGSNIEQGSAYIFRNLDIATGTITENVKLIATDGAEEDNFGVSISLDGDQFIIGSLLSKNGYPGKVYTGTVSSVTTLDAGDASRNIDGISFISQDDWIVGQSTDSNRVILLSGNAANIIASGKTVYIGKNAGSDSNTLDIAGALTASTISIGSVLGNTDNKLQLENTAAFSAIAFRLAPNNLLSIQGDYTKINTLLAYLGSTKLQTWSGTVWQDITAANYGSLLAETYNGGYTNITSVPEPSIYTMYAVLGGVTGFAFIRSRQKVS